MSSYIFAYHGGQYPDNEDEGAKHMAKWQAWIGGLGSAALNPGAPVGLSKTVSANGVSDDGGSNPLSGYTIVTADSMDAAINLTEDCPHLEVGGTIEVAEVLEM